MNVQFSLLAPRNYPTNEKCNFDSHGCGIFAAGTLSKLPHVRDVPSSILTGHGRGFGSWSCTLTARQYAEARDEVAHLTDRVVEKGWHDWKLQSTSKGKVAHFLYMNTPNCRYVSSTKHRVICTRNHTVDREERGNISTSRMHHTRTMACHNATA